EAVRDRSRRRGDPVADDPGPGLGEGSERTGGNDRSRARQGDLPRELAEPEGRRSDRPPDRGIRGLHPLRRHARARRVGRRNLGRDGGGKRGRDGARLHRWGAWMRPEALIEADGLAAGYGGAPAISGVAFTLRAGERMALLGPNGGGKTTLLRT